MIDAETITVVQHCEAPRLDILNLSKVQQFLNQHHYGMKQIPLDIKGRDLPQVLHDAHCNVTAGQHMKLEITFDVNGNRSYKFI